MSKENAKKCKEGLVELVDLLDKVIDGKMTQQQLADELGIHYQTLYGKYNQGFKAFLTRKGMQYEDVIMTCLNDMETPIEKLFRDVFSEGEACTIYLSPSTQDFAIKAIKEILPKRYWQFVNMHYGIDGVEPMTYATIGAEFGLSGCYVDSVVKHSYRILRSPLNRRKLFPVCKELNDNFGTLCNLKDIIGGIEEENAAVRAGIENALNSVSVEFFDFNARIYNALTRSGIVTVSDLLSKSEKDLKRIRYMSATSVKTIQETLAKYGLHLAD